MSKCPVDAEVTGPLLLLYSSLDFHHITGSCLTGPSFCVFSAGHSSSSLVLNGGVISPELGLGPLLYVHSFPRCFFPFPWCYIPPLYLQIQIYAGSPSFHLNFRIVYLIVYEISPLRCQTRIS